MTEERNKLPVLFTEAKIKEEVERMADEIVRKHGMAEIVLVGLLKGGAWLLADLSRAIEQRRGGGLLCADFMRFASYPDQARQSSGQVKMERLDLDTQYSVIRKIVIIVDDVAETCQTITKAKEYLETQKPIKVEVCVLVNKDCPRPPTSANPDYVGFDRVPVKYFLAGYGMNANDGGLRGLPCIVILPPKEEPRS